MSGQSLISSKATPYGLMFLVLGDVSFLVDVMPCQAVSEGMQ